MNTHDELIAAETGGTDGAALALVLRSARGFPAVEAPSPEFVEGLARRIREEAARSPARPRRNTARRRWASLAAAVAVGAVVLGTALGFIVNRDGAVQTASAAEILEEARNAASLESGARPASFSFTVRHQLLATPEGETTERPVHEVQLRRWVDDSGRWRTELWMFDYDDSGQRLEGTLSQVAVNDGTTLTTFANGEVTTKPAPPPDGVNTAFGMGTVVMTAGSATLEEALAVAAACREATLAGREDVAGRPTYVIALGADRCSPGHRPEPHLGFSVPSRIWVDEETFITLRWETPFGDVPNMRTVAEIMDLNLAPDFGLDTFRFTRP